jgi:predicted ATP-binding protein involved in virulence
MNISINTIRAKNFRLFEDISIELNPQFNVIVGNNGDGKSSILDIISIALGGFLLGFDGIPSNGILKTDVTFKTFNVGSILDRQPQYPVEVETCATVGDKLLTWKRSLNGEGGKTTSSDAKRIRSYAMELQKSVRNGNQEIILPILAYYGTNRLWTQKKDTSNTLDNSTMRFSAYNDCLSTSSNEKMMLRWFEKMTLIELQEQKKLPEFEAVKRAISQCFSGIDNHQASVEVRYSVKSHEIELIFLNSDGSKEIHPLRELSDGYRNTLSMISDIAYRMAMLNPQLLDDVTTQTSGVVLIDELDLHLHPQWQQRIVKDLTTIFPKVQFIVTTHSPNVIGSVPHEQLLILENHQVFKPSNKTYGRDVNAILSEIMNVPKRQSAIEGKFKEFYNAMDGEEYSKAKDILDSLERVLGSNDDEIVSARVSLELETLG